MPAIMLKSLQPSGIGSRTTSQAALSIAAPRTNRKMLCRAAAGEPKEDSDKKAGDSFAKIEAPVRSGIPDRNPTPVSERDYGNHLNAEMKEDKWNPDRKVLGTEVGVVDSLRFNGAVPEVANCRLAMLGFVLAVAGEAFTGRNVFQQVQHAPGLVASVFVLLIVATLVPTVRGVPRKGNAVFTPDAEIINGRVAMVAFSVLVLMSFYQGSYLGTLASWFS